MKIAAASTSNKDNGEISQRGGRAPFYQIFDETGKLVDTIKNPVEQGGGGVGPFVAKMLADKGITLFVAEKVGPNMVQAFEDHKIEYKEMSGDVASAIKEIVDN